MKAFFDILKSNELIYPNTIAYGWEPDNAIRRQGHPYYQWIQTDQGEGVVKISGQKIILQKNDGILISPFIPHSYSATKYWSTDFITICGYATPFFHKLLGDGTFFLLHDCTEIKEDIVKLTDMVDHNDSTNNISLVTYSIFTKIRQGIQKRYSAKERLSPINWEVKKYIDSHYMEKITIQKLSTTYHISPQYLIKIFKSATGKTPYQYLVQKRIIEAEKILVSNNDLLISEIASLCGFDNTSRFIEVFKKYKYCTPLEFRTIYYQGSDFKYE